MADDEANSTSGSEDPQERGIFDGFSGYVTPTEEDWKNVLSHGMVVIDTNVLLNLYRYNQDARISLLSTLQRFEDRLWVPHQVMDEFWRNRESALEDPGKQLDQSATALRADLQKAVSDLRTWINRVSLDHSNALQLESLLTHAFDEVISRMEVVVDSSGTEMTRDTTTDKVVSALAELLDRKVGSQLDPADYAAAIVEGKRRIEKEVPPGYKDKKKQSRGDDTEVGDYLVWLQLIREAKERRQDVLLVTGDAKEDWWRTRNGMTLGPRNELTEELLREAEVRLYMLKPDRLLTYARDFLQVVVTEDSVHNVEMVDAQSTANSAFLAMEGMAESNATGAVLWAWREVQAALIKALPDESLHPRRSSTSMRLRELKRRELITADVLQMVRRLQETRNSVVHTDEVELTPEGARSFISAAKSVVDALALSSTPQAQALRFEQNIVTMIRDAGFRVAPGADHGDRGYDFLVRHPSNLDSTIAVEVKYISRGSFGEAELERQKTRLLTLPDAVGSMLVVTNAALTDSVREFNSSATVDASHRLEGRRYMEVVQRRNTEDDHLVVRALIRAMP